MVTMVSFGGGVNSTALLVGMWEHQETPDVILFADTGGEKPETYAWIGSFNKWLDAHYMPSIETVSASRTLESECLERGTLPSIVFGRKSCSDHYKLRPQKLYMKGFGEYGTATGPIVRCIGFDAGEPQRAIESTDKDYTNRYPLIEWGWDREACIAAILRNGLCVPPKSSCFFCPNMREHEILELKEKHPDLFARAVAMERNARPNLYTIKGLARDLSWEQIGQYDSDQLRLMPKRSNEMPCECYDGE